MSIPWREGNSHKTIRISFHFFSYSLGSIHCVIWRIWLHYRLNLLLTLPSGRDSFVFYHKKKTLNLLFICTKISPSVSLSAQTDCSLETNMVDVRPKTIYCHCQWWMLLAIAAAAVAAVVACGTANEEWICITRSHTLLLLVSVRYFCLAYATLHSRFILCIHKCSVSIAKERNNRNRKCIESECERDVRRIHWYRWTRHCYTNTMWERAECKWRGKLECHTEHTNTFTLRAAIHVSLYKY